MSVPTTSIAFFVLVSLIASKQWRQRRKQGLPLPPGPRKLPIIGNLLSVPTQYQWVKYAQWAKEYALTHDIRLPSTPASSIIEVAYGIAVQPEDDPMIAIADKAFHHINEAGIPGTFLVDYIPILRHIPSWFPGASFQRFAQTSYKDMINMLDIPYAQVRDRLVKGEAISCLVTRVFGRNPQYLDDPKMERIVQDVASSAYTGGADTTNPPLLTFAAAMVLFPDVQKKAQAEIDQVLEGSRLPSFEDQGSLPYTQAMMWEIMRSVF
ncbi:hypothetical protein ONZ45_g9131 [Pleurotus djamor]|nr:hypothetical protein ONZ45_g9131 [Pleurotus djamor]